MRGISPDPETNVVQSCYAVVYVPRRSRNRFPANCVEIVSSREEAIAGSNPDAKRYAARVAGPSRSSEGLSLYYLVEWLD